ncbi:magnesium transporter CorA family protein [Bacillus cytotoxicus]|uniref:magnesium transporter CorA family protein n=1 Tax=unclassified Bacillus cereus group TaxID=2750818 RepID=UPI001F560C68|nr:MULTISPECIES: magnesium transporter CorA family protein [unclassified Bacillus cereus group]EMA6342061.1 magnesium transporter CorA family protein [Bacillus cytotoxicus]
MKCIKMSKWTWYHVKINELDQLPFTIFGDVLSYFTQFVKKTSFPCENGLYVYTLSPSQTCVYGSFLYNQDQNDAKAQKFFHYFVAQEVLITVQEKDEEDLQDLINEYALNIKNCNIPAEALCILLSTFISRYLQEVAHFENHFRNVLWDFHHHNNIAVLEKIYRIRHGLFIITHVFRLVQEVLQGMEEAWLEHLTKTFHYKQTHLKLERGLQLVKQYQKELDTMIHLQEVVSSHRGNEIMKSLTVLTAVSTPLTSLGALWGMNFKNMPELEWEYGYLIALVFIIFTTVGMYIYMRIRGWTGDLLRVRKKKTFFKSK